MAGMRPDLYQQMLREVSEQCRLADDLGYDSVELHRAPLPHRGLRGLQQPRAARPLHRHADQAHPRRPARHRAAGVQPDPRRRGHRHARPHDGRAGLRRLRARLPAPLGRHHGAADARHPRRAAAPARRDRRRQPRRLRGVLPRSSRRPGPRRCSPSRASSGRSRRARRPGRSRPRPSGARASRTASSRPSAWCPSRCRSRIRRSSSRSPPRRTRSAGAPRTASPPSCRRCTRRIETQPVRGLRLGLGPQARATAWACCATSSSPTPTRRRASCGSTRRRLPATPGSCRSASAAACSTPRRARRRRTEEAIAKGYALVGTVDTVTRSLEALKKKLPVNWIFGWTHNTLVPHAKLMRSIELFHTKVLPRVS